MKDKLRVYVDSFTLLYGELPAGWAPHCPHCSADSCNPCRRDRNLTIVQIMNDSIRVHVHADDLLSDMDTCENNDQVSKPTPGAVDLSSPLLTYGLTIEGHVSLKSE